MVWSKMGLNSLEVSGFHCWSFCLSPPILPPRDGHTIPADTGVEGSRLLSRTTQCGSPASSIGTPWGLLRPVDHQPQPRLSESEPVF